MAHGDYLNVFGGGKQSLYLRYGINEIETCTLRLGDGCYLHRRPGHSGASISLLRRIFQAFDGGV